jgi:hypothetical protein
VISACDCWQVTQCEKCLWLLTSYTVWEVPVTADKLHSVISACDCWQVTQCDKCLWLLTSYTVWEVPVTADKLHSVRNTFNCWYVTQCEERLWVLIRFTYPWDSQRRVSILQDRYCMSRHQIKYICFLTREIKIFSWQCKDNQGIFTQNYSDRKQNFSFLADCNKPTWKLAAYCVGYIEILAALHAFIRHNQIIHDHVQPSNNCSTSACL